MTVHWKSTSNNMFDNCQTIKEVKHTYRELVKKLHPDANHDFYDPNRFYELQNQYYLALQNVNVTRQKKEDKAQNIRDKIYRLVEAEIRENEPYCTIVIPRGYSGDIHLMSDGGINFEIKFPYTSPPPSGGRNSPIRLYDENNKFITRVKIIEKDGPNI